VRRACGGALSSDRYSCTGIYLGESTIIRINRIASALSGQTVQLVTDLLATDDAGLREIGESVIDVLRVHREYVQKPMLNMQPTPQFAER
jgi:hypothetical protein